jgi:chromosomal replication initiation ATPase DnaA
MPRRKNLILSAAQARLAYERVAEATGVSVDDMLGRRQTYEIARARFIVMRLLRNQHASYLQIGRAMDLDHSTVINGIQRFDWLLDQCPSFAALAAKAQANGYARR